MGAGAAVPRCHRWGVQPRLRWPWGRRQPRMWRGVEHERTRVWAAGPLRLQLQPCGGRPFGHRLQERSHRRVRQARKDFRRGGRGSDKASSLDGGCGGTVAQGLGCISRCRQSSGRFVHRYVCAVSWRRRTCVDATSCGCAACRGRLLRRSRYGIRRDPSNPAANFLKGVRIRVRVPRFLRNRARAAGCNLLRCRSHGHSVRLGQGTARGGSPCTGESATFGTGRTDALCVQGSVVHGFAPMAGDTWRERQSRGHVLQRVVGG
mmetsp:Transcript_49061/g.137348  ORF Transcript_49061/g.137348 Transcript_49061/m.137348 type:complete len:263 (-) Transcript_49061:1603-2391(-)